MAWVDSMRLRRRASAARAAGWVGLAITLIASAAEPDMLPVLVTMGGGVMALSYWLGYAVDKRAERVVTR